MNKFKGLILAEDAYGPTRRELLGRAPQLFPLANTPLLFYALETIRNASIDEVIIAAGPAEIDDLREAIGDRRGMGPLGQLPRGRQRPRAGPRGRDAEPLVGDSPLLVFEGGPWSRSRSSPSWSGSPTPAWMRCARRDGERRRRPPGPSSQGWAPASSGRGSSTPRRPSADGESGHHGLEAAVSWLVAAGGRVESHRVDGWWRNTGRPEDLLEANRILLDRLVDSVSAVNGRNAEVEGRVLIDDTATIESSRVRGPSVIGPGARIVDSYVGPYTSVGEEAIIENSEVENAIILPRATIEHFGLRVEESVIGEGAELRRTFRVPRGVSLSIGAESEIALS